MGWSDVQRCGLKLPNALPTPRALRCGCLHGAACKPHILRPTPCRLPHTCPPRAPAAAMAKVAGSLSKSTEVMKIVNNLMRVPELAKVMQDMSKGEEAGRAGLGGACGGGAIYRTV